ncbi:MAG: class I SAM-dependent methyltransferase [Minwuiales bacterium]|nr:class I SAM-dependent methyltransferase [Minwuiales bacterium]
MAGQPDFDTQAFRDFEQAGWQDLGQSYHAVTRDSTRHAAEHLLDAVDAGPGKRLLDIACGPGYSAGLAAERGAAAEGIDFAASMVAEAGRTYPAAQFREGDAEDLPFDDASFDAAVCAFGMLHFARPEQAAAEAHRVLKPGGRFAFTVWCTPDRVETFKIFRGAVEAHGTMDVPLPAGPPMFRFSDPAACHGLLAGAGFGGIEVGEITITRRTTPEKLVEGLAGATVRTRALIEAQTPDARAKIYAEILQRGKAMAKDGVLTLSMPAVLASARRN